MYGRLVSPFDFPVHTYRNRPGGEVVVHKSPNSPDGTGPRKAIPVVAPTPPSHSTANHNLSRCALPTNVLDLRT